MLLIYKIAKIIIIWTQMASLNFCSYLFGPVCCGAPTVHAEDIAAGGPIPSTLFVASGMGPHMYESTATGTLAGICPADDNIACCGPRGFGQVYEPDGCWTVSTQMGCCGPAGCSGCFAQCCTASCCSCGPEGFFGQCCGPSTVSQTFGPQGCCGCGDYCKCCACDVWANCCNGCGPDGCCSNCGCGFGGIEGGNCCTRCTDCCVGSFADACCGCCNKKVSVIP